jgi:hypothetical protein
MCGIAIEDDREVMDVLKCMLDGKSVDDDLLPEFLKMNKGHQMHFNFDSLSCYL